MRLSDQVRGRTMINDFRRNREIMDILRKEISSGKKILTVADDPENYSALLQYKDVMSLNNGFIRNIQSYQGELEIYENQIDQLAKSVSELKTLSIEASNDANYRDSTDTFRHRVNNILENIMSISNNIVNGKYLFAGSKTQTKPFECQRNSDEIVGVSYNGDNQPKIFNLYVSEKIGVNLSGEEIFLGRAGMGENIFQAVIDLRDDLKDDRFQNSEVHLDRMEKMLTRIIDKRGGLGGHIQHLNNLEDFMDNYNMILEEKSSRIEDVDMAEAISQLLAQESIIKASLEVASRLYRLSLLDHI